MMVLLCRQLPLEDHRPRFGFAVRLRRIKEHVRCRIYSRPCDRQSEQEKQDEHDAV